MSVLKRGFSGEKLGHSYRGRLKEVVARHTYRMTMVACVQPSHAGILLDDSGGGTPQRFMWFPGTDKRISENFPDWPLDSLGGRRTLSPDMPPEWQMSQAVGEVEPPAGGGTRDSPGGRGEGSW